MSMNKMSMNKINLRKLSGAWLPVAAQVYSGLILVWLLLRAVLWDAYWPIAIVNTAAFYCFVPLVLLLIPVVVSRHKQALGSLLIPGMAFLLFWGILLVPTSPAKRTSFSLRIMTFNVLVSNTASDKLTSSIKAEEPDVIGFQELGSVTIAALRSQLGNEYPYDTFDEFEPRGVGLMSRFPITAVAKFPFPPKDLALHALIDWDGQPVHVFVVHLSANNIFDNSLISLPQLVQERYTQRADQVTRLQEQLAEIMEPVVLLCDCNFTDTSEAYGRLNSRLNDSYRRPGWGPGHTLYTKGIPFRVQRVDYIWHSPHFVSRASHVGQDGGSDHRPVISTLSLLEVNP
ncbi:MAG: hypothetical protein HC804_09150 [Anaerolineae bacterium]|nr:hypothetical protein [Anaerolineae bacterium]